MIFVTVGSHTIGFERLIRHIDNLAPHINTKIIMQIGSSKYSPVNTDFFTMKPSIDQYLENAEVVIAQGSMIILETIKKSTPVIAIPRQKKFNEVIDDHQIEFCKNIAKNMPLKYFTDINLLDAKIINSYRTLLKFESNNLKKLQKYVSDYIIMH